ncbi:MAG: TRAP transporter small permease [Deltaproteobacteria bacterium]|nr:TRAP transporter small permease [Deltaproteobacteria bacterium]
MSHGFESDSIAKVSEEASSGLLVGVVRLIERCNEGVMGLSTIAILAASCILTLSVVSRYFLKVSTDWQDEASVFLLVGATFMCCAYVQSNRGHIGIDALASILPASVNRVRKGVVDIASLAFCTFFTWKSWTLFHEALVGGHTTSSSFAPPLWIPYGLMAVGMTNLTLQLLMQVLAYFGKREVVS